MVSLVTVLRKSLKSKLPNYFQGDLWPLHVCTALWSISCRLSKSNLTKIKIQTVIFKVITLSAQIYKGIKTPQKDDHLYIAYFRYHPPTLFALWPHRAQYPYSSNEVQVKKSCGFLCKTMAYIDKTWVHVPFMAWPSLISFFNGL